MDFMGGTAEVNAILNNDDVVELSLRRLVSHVYQSRTRDRAGAAMMIGLKPPGTVVDEAPTSLVEDFTEGKGKDKGKGGQGPAPH